MFPQIIKTKTRVITPPNGTPFIQFYNNKTKVWENDVTLNFKRSGMAIFKLSLDRTQEPYIFFGALQNTTCGSNPDTNWDFMINGAGNIICFHNNCNNKQDISIRLTLIPRGESNIADAQVSADPKLRNQPD